ncbi:MAG: 5-formyltetrahydrofolate cyclo-ligase [Magnetococcales bacterium]|nr:5-formyltetrahydrofolate cyclo-ligase [Magnetococcales bacterium]
MHGDKKVLRNRLREARRSLSDEDAARSSLQAGQAAISLAAYVRARSIGLYYPFDREVDTGFLRTHAVHVKKKVALPVVDPRGGGMVFVCWTPDTPMERGPFGIWQPRRTGKDGDTVRPGGMDVLFLPVVGFDRHGGRLGYGGGFFDRYLEGDRVVCRVGLAYGFQEVVSLPVERHDQKLHYVITENGVIPMPDAPLAS